MRSASGVQVRLNKPTDQATHRREREFDERDQICLPADDRAFIVHLPIRPPLDPVEIPSTIAYIRGAL